MKTIIFIAIALICLGVGGFLVYESEVNKSVKVTFSEMVLIPSGTFEMGGEKFFWENLISGDPLIRGPELPEMEWPSEELTRDERPIHQVSLNSFYLSKYETTNQPDNTLLDLKIIFLIS